MYLLFKMFTHRWRYHWLKLIWLCSVKNKWKSAWRNIIFKLIIPAAVRLTLNEAAKIFLSVHLFALWERKLDPYRERYFQYNLFQFALYKSTYANCKRSQDAHGCKLNSQIIVLWWLVSWNLHAMPSPYCSRYELDH